MTSARQRRHRPRGLLWRPLVLGWVVATVPAAWAFALPGAAGEEGRVDTVAGPTHCQATAEPTPGTVRALAVAPNGSVFSDTGAYDEGVVAHIRAGVEDESAPAELGGDPEPAGVATEPEMASPEVWRPGKVGSAGRLATNPPRGVLASYGDRVVDVVSGDVVAGTPHISTVAGESGAGAQATDFVFSWILSIATDEHGNLVVSEVTDPKAQTFRIWFINRGPDPMRLFAGEEEVEIPPGGVSAIADNEVPAGGGDRLLSGWPALASIGGVMYVATTGVDPSGTQRSTIQAVNLGSTPRTAHGVELMPGLIKTITGGPVGFEGDGGDTSGARFGRLPGISSAGDGSLYIADIDNHRVRRIDSTGLVSTFAGSGTPGPTGGGYDGNDQPAASSLLRRPLAVQATGDGRVYISDSENGQVRYVDPGGVIHGLPMGLGPAAICGEPTPDPHLLSVASDESGAVYYTADGLSQVKRVDATGAVTNVAGRAELTIRGQCQRWPPGCPTSDRQAGTETSLDRPTSLAKGLGGLYLFDSGHRAVRFVNTSDRPVRIHGLTVTPGQMRVVVAGRENALSRRIPGPAADLSTDVRIAADRLGNLFVADLQRARVWQVDRRGKTTEVLEPTSDKERCCSEPISIASSTEGHLFILDKPTNRVWFRNLSDTSVTVLGREAEPGAVVSVLGNGDVGVMGEGIAAQDTGLQRPVAIAVGASGDLFVADDEDDTVGRVDSQGIVRAVVGSGQSYFAFNGDGQRALFTLLADPEALAVDACGRLLIADVTNARVRRVNLTPPCIPSGNLGGIAPPSRNRMGLIVALIASVGLLTGGLVRRRRRTRKGANGIPRKRVGSEVQ